MNDKQTHMRFKDFSTDELLAEIVRRRNARVSRRPIVKCDGCKHFQTSETRYDDDTYNPCQKGHEMSFRFPEADDGPADCNDDWGYYRRVCPDRELRA